MKMKSTRRRSSAEQGSRGERSRGERSLRGSTREGAGVESKTVLAKVCKNRKYIMIVLLIAIFDALLAATRLTADILAMKNEKEEVCNAGKVLHYLNTTHHGDLDDYFEDNSIDEIYEDLKEETSMHIHKRSELLNYEFMDRYKIGPQLESMNRYKRDPHLESIDIDVEAFLSRAIRAAQSAPPDDKVSGSGFVWSVRLYEVANIFDIISAVVLLIAFIMKLIRLGSEGKRFFRSKLQVMDAVVILIALPLDIVFFPPIWASHNVFGSTFPLIVDVTTRIIRVVLNSLLNLQAQDKELLAQEAEKLRFTSRQYRIFKRHVLRLQELARDHSATDKQLAGCMRLVQTKKRKKQETKTVKGIMSVNRLLFTAAPIVYPEANQHIKEEEDAEDQADWVHARVISKKNGTSRRIRFLSPPPSLVVTPPELTLSTSSLASATSSNFGGYDSEGDDSVLVEDTTDYNNFDLEDQDDSDHEDDEVDGSSIIGSIESIASSSGAQEPTATHEDIVMSKV